MQEADFVVGAEPNELRADEYFFSTIDYSFSIVEKGFDILSVVVVFINIVSAFGIHIKLWSVVEQQSHFSFVSIPLTFPLNFLEVHQIIYSSAQEFP